MTTYCLAVSEEELDSLVLFWGAKLRADFNDDRESARTACDRMKQLIQMRTPTHVARLEERLGLVG